MNKPPAKKRVAVVDDHEGVRRSLTALLEVAGYDVVTYDSGDAFLEKGLEPAPDCVVLDLEMPRLDGRQVIETLTALEGVPRVIVVSATQDADLIAATELPVVTAFLPKPMSPDALLDAVKRALSLLGSSL